MGWLNLHHVQLTMPTGKEPLEQARRFYVGGLGFFEVEKPEHLKPRGGIWFAARDAGGVELFQVHMGLEEPTTTRRHPAFLTDDLLGVRARLEASGYSTTEDEPYPGFKRCYVRDPFGNRIELLERL